MKPPREVTFFTDRDLGLIVPRFLRDAGAKVEAHDDHFDQATLDVEWLREVGGRGWVALSHNKKIRYNPEERDMAMRAGLALFFLIGDRTHPELAKNLVQTLPKVHRFVSSHARPFIAKIHAPPTDQVDAGKAGRVTMWLDHSNWLARFGP